MILIHKVTYLKIFNPVKEVNKDVKNQGKIIGTSWAHPQKHRQLREKSSLINQAQSLTMKIS